MNGEVVKDIEGGDESEVQATPPCDALMETSPIAKVIEICIENF